MTTTKVLVFCLSHLLSAVSFMFSVQCSGAGTPNSKASTMSDFRSLLSTFQDATGSNSVTNKVSNRSSTLSRNNEKNNHRKSQTKLSSSSNDEEMIAHEDDIDKLWRISQIQSSIATSHSYNKRRHTEETKKPLHVAICATVVSSLPHEDIWKLWLSHTYDPSSSQPNQNDNNNSYNNNNNNNAQKVTASIHVHAKSPNLIPNGSWLKSKLIPISHNPNWNDYRIIKAMLSLAEYAIQKEPQTTHLMMVTESCIPIGTLADIANVIYKHGVECSFLDCYGRDSHKCTRYDEHTCFNIKGIPKDAIYKALPGWALFSRSHIDEIMDISDRLSGKELYPLFKNVWAPEEVYFPTALALLGKLEDYVVRKSLMWSKWDESLKNKDRAHPILYDGKFSKALIDDVYSQGFLFMRKFKYKLDSCEWKRIVMGRKDVRLRSSTDNITTVNSSNSNNGSLEFKQRKRRECDSMDDPIVETKRLKK